MILNICETPNVLEVLRIVQIVINILKIVVPIILILSIMIGMTRTVTNGELEKEGGAVVAKVVAAVLIFLIPTLVSIVVRIAGGSFEYKDCLLPITMEQINALYVQKAEELVTKAEKSRELNDYTVAHNYLTHVKEREKRVALSDRLAVIKKEIDEKTRVKEPEVDINDLLGNYPSKTYGYCTFEKKSAGGMTYGLCVPTNYNKSEKIALIVWLHGSGEVGVDFGTFRSSGMLGVVENWKATGFKEIPAIVVAPQIQSGYWYSQSAIDGVRSVINAVKSNYNINTSKIALIGHSRGGTGVIYVAAANQNLFSCVVVLSGYLTQPPSGSEAYFRKIPIKGYSEEGDAYPYTYSFFQAIGKTNQLTKLQCTHGQVPGIALKEDANGDGISDLIQWMLSH